MSRFFTNHGPKGQELRDYLAMDKRRFDVLDIETQQVLYKNISYLETRELYDDTVNPCAEYSYGAIIVKEIK